MNKYTDFLVRITLTCFPYFSKEFFSVNLPHIPAVITDLIINFSIDFFLFPVLLTWLTWDIVKLFAYEYQIIFFSHMAKMVELEVNGYSWVSIFELFSYRTGLSNRNGEHWIEPAFGKSIIWDLKASLVFSH